MPVLGLGVYQAAPGRTTESAVTFALKNAYRLVDTAKLYGNERDVGKAVMKSGIDRKEVFVTTKLWNSDHGYDSTMRAFDKSLSALGLDYIDLYLIHWPVSELRGESWKAMTKLLKDGRVRAIGVSNYMIRHLKELLDSSDIIPAVNQVEFHPFLYQKDLLQFCRDHSIQTEAYSPLTRGSMLTHSTITSIAKKYGKSPAQVMIRWGLQHGLVEIPKSTNESRIIENSQVFDFEISGKDMQPLDSLDRSMHTDWDPAQEP
jgi:methylglyoxal/glyoxal reductase